MLPIALQLYSVREDLETDFEGTLRKVKDLGYDGIELAGLCGKSPAEIKSLADELGLVPLSAHVPFADLIGEPEKVLGDYAAIGCRYVVIPYLLEEYRPGTAGFDVVIESARKLGKLASGLGMTLLYHNHDFEFVKLDGKYALDVLYDSVDESLLQTEIDTCWVRVAGEDPAQYVRKYAGRAPVVHLKDYWMTGSGGKLYELIGVEDEAQTTGEDSFEFRPLGQGMQDIPAILKAADDAGSRWVVVEQDRPSRGKTSMECAEQSLQYLKGLK